MSTHPFLFTIALLLALGLVTACGKKEAAKVPTQVAARVNSDEITVHQINNVLVQNPGIAPEAADQSKREILDRLINQQLARQQAIARALDRSPSIMQAIEAAKTEILARAYLEQVAATIPKTANWEVQKYYREHPELFAKRRVFNLEEIAFVAKSDVANGLREQLSKFRTMQDIADWLQSRGTKLALYRGVRAAEQIPLEILPKLQAMRTGQNQLFELGGDRYLLIGVVTYREEPVEESVAAPRIQQYLWNQRSAELIGKEMKKMKEQAKIEYLGEFAGSTTLTEQAKAQNESVAKPQDGSQAKSVAGTRTGTVEAPKEQPRK